LGTSPHASRAEVAATMAVVMRLLLVLAVAVAALVYTATLASANEDRSAASFAGNPLIANGGHISAKVHCGKIRTHATDLKPEICKFATQDLLLMSSMDEFMQGHSCHGAI
jgi:hypothetical protein